MLIAAAAFAYMPLALSLVLYARARRYPYALQVFDDSLRKVGGQVTTASFLLTLPAVYLILLDEILTARIDWNAAAAALSFIGWLAAYPLTLLVFHSLYAALHRTEPYAPPYSIAARISLDLMKHAFLCAILSVAVYAGGQTLHPEKLMLLKNAAVRIGFAS